MQQPHKEHTEQLRLLAGWHRQRALRWWRGRRHSQFHAHAMALLEEQAAFVERNPDQQRPWAEWCELFGLYHLKDSNLALQRAGVQLSLESFAQVLRHARVRK